MIRGTVEQNDCGGGWTPQTWIRIPDTSPSDTSGELVGELTQRVQQTELVSLGIGQHCPRRIALPDVDSDGTDIEQALQLSLVVTVDRAHVDVQPQLLQLGVCARHEHEGWSLLLLR